MALDLLISLVTLLRAVLYISHVIEERSLIAFLCNQEAASKEAVELWALSRTQFIEQPLFQKVEIMLSLWKQMSHTGKVHVSTKLQTVITVVNKAT